MAARSMASPYLYIAALLACAAVLAPAAHAGDPPLYLDKDEVSLENDLLTLQRPDREWVFIDTRLQYQMLMRERPAAEVDAAFRGLLARLHHPGLRATLSVYAFDLPSETPASKRAVDLKAELRARGVKVRSLRVGPLRGRAVVRVEYRVPQKKDDDDSEPLAVTRVDCPRPDRMRLVVLVFEVPLEHRRAGGALLKQILKRIRW